MIRSEAISIVGGEKLAGYNIASLVLFAIELALIGFFIYKAVANRVVISKKTYWYFAPVFILLTVMHIMGYLYANEEKIGIIPIIQSLSAAFKSFSFSYQSDMITPLALASPMFLTSFIIALAMAIATVFSSVAYLFKNYIKNLNRVNNTIQYPCDFAIGYSEDAISYAMESGNNVVIILNGCEDKAILRDLYYKKIPYIKGMFAYGLINRKTAGKADAYNFIAFNVTEEEYGKYTSNFSKIYNGANNQLFLEVKQENIEVVESIFIDNKISNLEKHDMVNREAKTKQQKISSRENATFEMYKDLYQDSTMRYTYCFNRHELIAQKLLFDEPITKHIPNDFYTEEKTLKPEKEINIFFVGFGKVNFEMFKMSYSANQIASLEGSRMIAKPINYYIYDNDQQEYIDDYLNSIESMTLSGEKIVNIQKNTIDVKTNAFIKDIDEKTKNENAYNFIYVSYGDDFNNASLALKINSILSKDNHKIYVRLKNTEAFSLKEVNIERYGSEKEILTHGEIVSSEVIRLAMYLNISYERIKNIHHIKSEDMLKLWAELDAFTRNSNIASTYGLQFKLNKIGYTLDLRDASSEQGMSAETVQSFNDSLLKDANISEGHIGERSSKDLSVIDTLAYEEHLRWSAFHFSKGWTPMSLDKIQLDNNGKVINKDIKRKEHSCLVSYDDLTNIHEAMSKVSSKDIDSVSTYKYDYLPMIYLIERINKTNKFLYTIGEKQRIFLDRIK